MSCRPSSGGASGGDPGGEGAVGSGSSGGGRRAGSAAWAGPEPEGRPAYKPYGEPDEKAQADPESSIMMPSNEGFQRYNAQVAVDAEHQLVVATSDGEREAG